MFVTRKFKCIESFESEQRYCLEGKTYFAYKIGKGWSLVFENGEMSFTESLFERVVEDWKVVLTEIV
jgi:hypothetical protein